MSMPAISLHQPWASLCVTRQPGGETCQACGETYSAVYWLPDNLWRAITPKPGQPGAGLLCPKCASHRLHRLGDCRSLPPNHSMVKTFETRSWPCPPNLIGQRIALHATKRKPPTIPGENALAVGDYRCWSISQRQPDHPHGAHPGASYIGHADPRLLMMNPLPLGAIIGSAVVEACYPIVGEHDHPLPKPWIERTDQNLLHLVRWDGWSDISDQLPYGDFTPGRYAWLLTDANPVQERCPWCNGFGYDTGRRDLLRGSKPCPVCDGVGHCDPIPARGHQRIWRWTP